MALTFCCKQGEGTMPTSWNAETYRERARQWQAQAERLPRGQERDTCLTLAEGYAHLAELIEGSGSLNCGAISEPSSAA
jgi:hypothetical protein